MTTSSTSWWPWLNVYVLYFLVAERLRPLHLGGHTCVPQLNIKIVSTTSRRPSALQRLSSATSNSPDRHNVQSWERRTQCLWHWSRLGFISENNMNTSTHFVRTTSLIYVMKLIIIFGIKIYQKFPSYLTVSWLLINWNGVELITERNGATNRPGRTRS